MIDHEMHEHGFKMLFHPILVHYPIAFYFLELILLLFWVVKQNDDYRRFALFSFKAGYLFMIAAMIAGYRDSGGWHDIVGTVRLHFFAAVAVFIFYTGRAFYWRFVKETSIHLRGVNTPRRCNPGVIQLLLAILGNLLVALTGYLGGKLVYGDWA